MVGLDRDREGLATLNYCARLSNKFDLLFETLHDPWPSCWDSDEICKALQDGGIDSKAIREKLYTIVKPSMGASSSDAGAPTSTLLLD